MNNQIILPIRYAIKFNVRFVPLDFDKWIKLDTSIYEINSKIELNNYKSLIIKSKESYILLDLGGIYYTINQNFIFFPLFPFYHYCYIKLSPNIDIYINPNFEPENNDELNKLMINNSVIFVGMNIINEKTNELIDTSKYNLMVIDKMIGMTTKKYVDFDIEKFYYEYEKENNKLLGIDNKKIINDICLIDKFYQLDAIKICKFI